MTVSSVEEVASAAVETSVAGVRSLDTAWEWDVVMHEISASSALGRTVDHAFRTYTVVWHRPRGQTLFVPWFLLVQSPALARVGLRGWGLCALHGHDGNGEMLADVYPGRIAAAADDAGHIAALVRRVLRA